MPDKIWTPGLYGDISAEHYFADPCPRPSLTQSIAKVLLAQSPLHAKHEHPRLAPPAEAEEEPAEKYLPAQAIGNAVHRTLIGRGKDLAIAEFDNWKSGDAKKFRAEAEQAGRTPILNKHMLVAQQMVLAVRLQLTDAGWPEAFKEGRGEVVACWEEGGLWFRTMIDWLTPDGTASYDLKSTAASFAPHVINRKMVDDGWDLQAAMHERALNALDPAGAGRRKFRFVAVENYPPYALLPIEMTEAWLTMGRKKLEVAISMWSDAIKSGRFTGYPTKPYCPEYPGFKETEWLGREVEYFDAKPQRDAANLGAG